MIELQIDRPGKGSQFDFIKQSQESWRYLKRGAISKPQEIRGISSALDKTIKRVFENYIPSDRPSPIIVWSVLKDEPSEPKSFQFEPRLPKGMTEQEGDAYFAGIYQFNEWATNFAAKYWLTRVPQQPVLQRMFSIYMDISINAGQKLVYKRAFNLMDQVKASIKSQEFDFDDAILKAFFQHDFDDINLIVSRAGITNCQTLDQLALHLGKGLPKKTLTSFILDDLATQEQDTPLKGLSKRVLSSIFTRGRVTNPGVVEILVVQPAIMFGLGATTNTTVVHDALYGITAGTVVGAITGSTMGYAIAHETMHDYSLDPLYSGLMPLTLVKKEKG